MELTIETFYWLDKKCSQDNEVVAYHDISPSDVLYSYLHFEKQNFNWDGTFHIITDWDEGEFNDPFWNKELNRCSAECFVLETCKELHKKLTGK